MGYLGQSRTLTAEDMHEHSYDLHEPCQAYLDTWSGRTQDKVLLRKGIEGLLKPTAVGAGLLAAGIVLAALVPLRDPVRADTSWRYG